MYEQVISQQLMKDVVLAVLSLGLIAWGYWLPLPGIGPRRAPVIVGLGRAMVVISAIAFVVLLRDAFETYQDLRLGEPEEVTARVVEKDVRAIPFRRNGALYLASMARPFVLPLEQLSGIQPGDTVRLEYARHSGTVLKLEKLQG